MITGSTSDEQQSSASSDLNYVVFDTSQDHLILLKIYPSSHSSLYRFWLLIDFLFHKGRKTSWKTINNYLTYVANYTVVTSTRLTDKYTAASISKILCQIIFDKQIEPIDFIYIFFFREGHSRHSALCIRSVYGIHVPSMTSSGPIDSNSDWSGDPESIYVCLKCETPRLKYVLVKYQNLFYQRSLTFIIRVL